MVNYAKYLTQMVGNQSINIEIIFKKCFTIQFPPRDSVENYFKLHGRNII
jgi:hypothetical protein